MPGIKIFTISVLLATALSAATPEYFPLQPGNAWVYSVSSRWFNGEPQSIEVESPETIDGRIFYAVRYFGQRLLLRNADDGSVVAYDSNTKLERPWIAFGTPEGQSFPAGLDNCTSTGKVESANAKISAPIGDFSNALRISFQARCADAGVTEQHYLPYVGLLRHIATTIAGPVQYDLAYVRTGATTADAGQLSFSLSLDASAYRPGSTSATLRLTLRNSTANPLKLTFPSGQTYDAHIRNDKGEVVYTWSATRSFIQVFREETLGFGERNYAFTVPIGTLPAGRYTVEAYLTTQPRLYSASSSFEILR